MYYFLLIIWLVLLCIMQIIYLVKSIKSKSNKNWLILFTMIGSSIVSIFMFFDYSLLTGNALDIVLMYIICFTAIILDVILLFVGIILKLLEVNKYRKNKIVREKVDKKNLKRSIFFPLFGILFVSSCICFADYIEFRIQKNIETELYNETKKNEIEKMVNFINKKYDLDFKIEDCKYYKEEENGKHANIFGNGKTYSIPYIAVFEKVNQKITVVDRNGVISDNAQLKDLNNYIADYFSKIANTNIDFVQIRSSYFGKIEDDTINNILQKEFNEKITQNNSSDFIDKILKEDDLELLFYVKDTEDRMALINKLTAGLDYLKEYDNINKIVIYVFDKNEDLLVNHITQNLKEEDKQSDISDDYEEQYIFGYYYVPNHFEYDSSKDEKCNTFVASAYCNLNRGYKPNQENKTFDKINDWYVYTY